MTKAKNRFYAYWIDGRGEIVSSWRECEAAVKGKKARYKGFVRREDALAWLNSGASYERKANRKAEERAELPPNAVYFDAGTGGGNGVEVNVTDVKGDPLLHLLLSKNALTERGTHLLPPGKTNNYGELFACSAAIRIASTRGASMVCGDSALIIDYWSVGKMRAVTRRGDPAAAKLVDRTTKERKLFEKNGGNLTRIPGGVNPADLGFHRD